MSANWVANNYYFVRRLHSLLGIVPLSLFMIAHFLVNSLSTVGVGEFNTVAGALAKMPYLIAIELGVIIIPLYIHGILGFWIVCLGSVETRVPYARNWFYLLQRATGLIVLLFVTYHVLATRIWHALYPSHDLYTLMHNYLTNPFLFAIYHRRSPGQRAFQFRIQVGHYGERTLADLGDGAGPADRARVLRGWLVCPHRLSEIGREYV